MIVNITCFFFPFSFALRIFLFLQDFSFLFFIFICGTQAQKTTYDTNKDKTVGFQQNCVESMENLWKILKKRERKLRNFHKREREREKEYEKKAFN